MADFRIAYAKTNRNEGGYSNVSTDSGGETYCGISRKFWPKWEGWKIVDENKPLKRSEKINSLLLENLKKQFYKVNFWDLIGGDEIDYQPNADTLYDFGVNANYPPSIKNMQKALGLTQSGKISDKLIEAINNPIKYLVMLLMAFTLFSCKPNIEVKANPDVSDLSVKLSLAKERIAIQDSMIDFYQGNDWAKKKPDTIFIYSENIKKYDSLDAINKNLGNQLLHKKLIIENAKYYLNIVNKNPKQTPNLRGWMNRALNQ